MKTFIGKTLALCECNGINTAISTVLRKNDKKNDKRSTKTYKAKDKREDKTTCVRQIQEVAGDKSPS